eukprot:24967_1
MMLVFMLIAFIVHVKGIHTLHKPYQSNTSLITSIIQYLNRNETVDSFGDVLKYILDDPVLYPSIVRKLAQDRIRIDLLAYLSHHSLELFKSLVIVDDWPQNEQATMDAWKYMKLLKGRSRCLYINAYNKNDSKKLHVTLHTSDHFLLRMNYSDNPAKKVPDLMNWSHIPSFLTSLTAVYHTSYMGEDKFVNIDFTSLDPSCKLRTLNIQFTNGWIDFPDYSLPSSLKLLRIKSDIILLKKQTDYQRLWIIGSHIEELYIGGMCMDLRDFNGFENMIRLKMMHVECLGWGSIWVDILEFRLQKLFQNSLRVDPTLVFSVGENYRRRMYFNRSEDITLTINDRDNGTRFADASDSIMSPAAIWCICVLCVLGVLAIAIPLYVFVQ